MAIKRMKGYVAGVTTLLVALAVAIFAYKMPAGIAIMSASQGAVYGLFANRLDYYHFCISL
ncbi:hypothetical protein GCM10020331_057080 [Ectobacillus funiculus]